MLRAATKISASAIVLRGHDLLSEGEIAALEEFLGRRQRREPLQHILGESYFMGLKFLVDKRVLIPRPETELLVEAAVRLLKDKVDLPVRFIDIGAGSGAIALSLLRLCPDTTAVAWELSPEAGELCLANARALGVSERLNLQIGDFFQKIAEPAAVHGHFDLFLSNPPYIAPDLMEGLEPEVRDFEPHLALVGKDSDGLGFYRSFARELKVLASPRGASLLAEFGEGQGEKIRAIFEEAGWADVRLLTDLSAKDRIVMASLPAQHK